jgi:uncharacterized protein YacL
VTAVRAGRLAPIAALVLGGALGVGLGPATWPGPGRFVLGLAGAALVLVLDRLARPLPVGDLVWGTAGTLVGLLGGLALGTAVEPLLPSGSGALRGACALGGGALGLAVSLGKRRDLAGASARLLPGSAGVAGVDKLLDTSVIIDGRIADICAAGFVEGPLVVPAFVLRELRLIADSPDSLRRNRGKRGFEVLERLRRLPHARVEVRDVDVPPDKAVDDRLVEAARSTGATLVTNDQNLSKVAALSGLRVLNVNELAAAVRTVVLPGEVMGLQVQREGKEPGQGVAYLDDGTMVVVEQGRRLIGQSADVVVTSVLQTTAGRMIFARPAPADEPSRR